MNYLWYSEYQAMRRRQTGEPRLWGIAWGLSNGNATEYTEASIYPAVKCNRPTPDHVYVGYGDAVGLPTEKDAEEWRDKKYAKNT